MNKLLLSVFGKQFYKWKKHQELKDDEYEARCDLMVQGDSLQKLEDQKALLLASIEGQEEHKTEVRDVKKQVADIDEQLLKLASKMDQTKFYLKNLDYSRQILKRL